MHFYFDWSNGTRMLLVLTILVMCLPIFVHDINTENTIRKKLRKKFPSENFDIRGSVLGTWPFDLTDSLYAHNPELIKEIETMRVREGWSRQLFWVPWLLSSIAILI